MPFIHDLRSAPVPGCVDGWIALHARHGHLDLSEVFTAAISYASEGFPASPLLAGTVRNLDGVAGCPELNSVGMRNGQIVRRPGVASALRAVVQHGRDGYYQGDFGRGLLSMGAGEYRASDFELPLADWVQPLKASAWGHDLWTIPPNSQGYLTLLGSLIAEGLPLPEDPGDPQWAHLLIESARVAAYDRPSALYESADVSSLFEPDEVARRPVSYTHLDVYKRQGESAAQAVVVDRQHVWTTQAEDKEHLCGPLSDPSDAHETLDQLPVIDAHRLAEGR